MSFSAFLPLPCLVPVSYQLAQKTPVRSLRYLHLDWFNFRVLGQTETARQLSESWANHKSRDFAVPLDSVLALSDREGEKSVLLFKVLARVAFDRPAITTSTKLETRALDRLIFV